MLAILASQSHGGNTSPCDCEARIASLWVPAVPSSIPPPLNPHNRRVDDCVAGKEEVLIEGVEVEVEAEEVAEDVGVGQKNYEEPGPRGSAADFLLGEEMEGDPSGREEVEAAAIKPASHSPQHH